MTKSLTAIKENIFVVRKRNILFRMGYFQLIMFLFDFVASLQRSMLDQSLRHFNEPLG